MMKSQSVAALLLIALITSGAFIAGRILGERTPAEADLPPREVSDNLQVATPAPNETPDFSEPFWYAKWLNADEALPRFDQTIAGIRVGPTAARSGSPCDSERPVDVPYATASGTSVAIEPKHLPQGGQQVSSLAVQCGAVVALAELRIELPSVNDLQDRVARGEHYFDIPRGGLIQILRFLGDPAEASSIAAERWSAGTIAGHPAAIGRPVLDEGLGDSMTIVHSAGLVTVIRATNLSLAELLRVTEGVLE